MALGFYEIQVVKLGEITYFLEIDDILTGKGAN